MKLKRAAGDLLFILLCALSCHFLFSQFGFNPTDEGFVLSASNRVLHGQIPHLDFSSVRPLGYAYLHIPELLIDPAHAFLVSRFVFWLEEALIALLWVKLLERSLALALNPKHVYALSLLTFIFNVHYFPCSVLHTIDGLLFSVAGLLVAARKDRFSLFGFLLIGFAALCKQNYLIVLPFSLYLFGKKNMAGKLLIGLLPVAAYVTWISACGGWNDLLTQLSGHHELFQVGVLSYLINYVFAGGFILAVLLHKFRMPAGFYSLLLIGILCLLMLSDHYHGKWVFFLPGMMIYEWVRKDGPVRETLLLALLLAWCVSISVGYNTPALFAGACLSLLLLIRTNPYQLSTKVSYLSIVILFAIFYHVRTTTIYRDCPSAQLNAKLDGVVNGAKGILTNANTYSVLKELDSLRNVYPGMVALPDFTACNVFNAYQSPILTEWPNKTEIPNEAVLKKVIQGLSKTPGVIFAISKYQTALLKDGFSPMIDGGMDYPILKYIKGKYTKIGESRYYELYR